MISVYVAALIGFAVLFGTFVRFIGGQTEATFMGLAINLASSAFVAYAAYAISNQIAAHKRRPEDAGTDFVFSAIISAGLTFVAYQVWKVSPVRSVQDFINLPSDVMGLFLATVYSWVDVSINQIGGWRQALAVLGKSVFTGLLVGTVGLLVILILGADFPNLKEQIFAPSPVARQADGTQCKGKYEFTGYFTDGRRIYLCNE